MRLSNLRPSDIFELQTRDFSDPAVAAIFLADLSDYLQSAKSDGGAVDDEIYVNSCMLDGAGIWERIQPALAAKTLQLLGEDVRRIFLSGIEPARRVHITNALQTSENSVQRLPRVDRDQTVEKTLLRAKMRRAKRKPTASDKTDKLPLGAGLAGRRRVPAGPVMMDFGLATAHPVQASFGMLTKAQAAAIRAAQRVGLTIMNVEQPVRKGKGKSKPIIISAEPLDWTPQRKAKSTHSKEKSD